MGVRDRRAEEVSRSSRDLRFGEIEDLGWALSCNVQAV